MKQDKPTTHDSRLEFQAVVVLALGFGLVGLDRFMITTLFPVIAKDLSLDYGDIGIITGALAIAWGVAALFMGNLSDRIGRRKILVGSLVVFSLLIGLSGLAGGLAFLVLIRVLMGLADGAYVPASIAATIEVSPLHRRGRNIGLQQMMVFLFGLGFAPLLIPPLLQVINWRWVFVLITIPGLILTWFTWRIIPPHVPSTASVAHHERTHWSDLRSVFAYSNIRIGMGLMLASLTVVTVSAFLPHYLMEHLHLSFAQMGTVMSAIGFGAMAGSVALPWLSDRVGRKPAMLTGNVIVLVSLALLSLTGPDVTLLFACIFFMMFGVLAIITLTVGPLCPETVPPHLIATSSGLIIATGELFGGGLAPILMGTVAKNFGIEHILWLPMAAMVISFVLCTRLRLPR